MNTKPMPQRKPFLARLALGAVLVEAQTAFGGTGARRRPWVRLAAVVLLAGSTTMGWAQTTGDFQSHQTGNWNDVNTWERWSGTSWVTPAPSTPTSAGGAITIRNGHTVTVTAGVTVDQVVVGAGGSIVINSGITLTIANGAGDDLTVNGTLTNNGTLSASGATVTVNGTFVNAGTATSGTKGASHFLAGSCMLRA